MDRTGFQAQLADVIGFTRENFSDKSTRFRENAQAGGRVWLKLFVHVLGRLNMKCWLYDRVSASNAITQNPFWESGHY
jgi:hypothetical protein